MIKDKLILKARVLFLKKKYDLAIDTLKPNINQYQDDFHFNYYFGFCYFFKDDFTKAYTYLKTAQIQSKDNIEILLAIAVIFLYRKNYERAIETWLSVLDKNKKNKQANFAIKFFANVDLDTTNYDALKRTGKIKKMIPTFGIYISPLTYYFFFIAMLVGITAYYSPVIIKKIQNRMLKYREGLEKIYELQTNITYSDDKNYSVYKYTKKELEEYVNNLMLDFSKKEDNKVRIGINRILLSNASYEMKDKVKSVLDYLFVPDFTNFSQDQSPDFKDIEKEPILYNGVYVRWKGSIANLVRHDKFISLDFLLGYQDHKLVLAQIPTIFSFPVDIDSGDSIEIIARVGLTNNNELKLDGSSVRKLKRVSQIKDNIESLSLEKESLSLEKTDKSET